MSADQDSSTDLILELDLPEAIVSKAVVLAGEWAWPSPYAEEVVMRFQTAGKVVSGVELWQNQDGSPKWLATSNYSVDLSDEHEMLVSASARDALEFIARFRDLPGALFNF
jgi:hypothetical protein